jgi:Ca2+/Na+ antiporter
MNFSELLQIIALIVFIVAAIGITYKKSDLISAGLAIWVLSWLVDGRLHHLNLGTILLLLAFVVFLLAAIGWGYKKVGLIAVGLALWAAAVVVPKFVGG